MVGAQVNEAVGVCPHLLRDQELTLPEFALAHLSSNYQQRDVDLASLIHI